MAYNSLILNSVYEKMLANDAPQEVINEFIQISPIAWTHTLLAGRYNFRKSDGEIDVEVMALILEKHVRQHFWKEE